MLCHKRGFCLIALWQATIAKAVLPVAKWHRPKLCASSADWGWLCNNLEYKCTAKGHCAVSRAWLACTNTLWDVSKVATGFSKSKSVVFYLQKRSGELNVHWRNRSQVLLRPLLTINLSQVKIAIVHPTDRQPCRFSAVCHILHLSQ